MNIIYVDDEPLQLENFRLTVEGMEGMESLQLFGNSVEACEWAKTHRVDVAFLDIEMPHMSGLELTRKLKELNRDTRVIMVTAYDQHSLEAFRARATSYLLKPYSREDIETELENALYHYPVAAHPSEKRIQIVTMPDLLVTVNGKTVFNGHSKQEELFALLVDRGEQGITKGEALACLGDGKVQSNSTYWSWMSRLRNILEDAGVSDLIGTKGYVKYLHTEKVDCDLYRMLDGDREAAKKYAGRYLERYSWAENRKAELDEIKNAVNSCKIYSNETLY